MSFRTSDLARKLDAIGPGILIFLLACVSNLILALLMPRVDWSVRGETSRIAASLATGHGFSSPFRLPTGPSALIPPVYPFLLAGIFRVFGVYTIAADWAATIFNILVHGLSCVLLFQTAAETFDRRSGILAAVALATFPLLFYPLVMLHVLGNVSAGAGLFILPAWIWNTFLLEFAILALIRLTQLRVRWVAYGAAWGVAILIDPNVLSVAPAFFAWWMWRRESWRHLFSALAVMALCISPWLVRNYEVFHHFIFIRDGLGLELRVGNQPGNGGLWTASLHPASNPAELNRMIALGEFEYTRLAGQEAIASIRAHPSEYVRDSMLRVIYFWIGTPAASSHLQAFRFLKYSVQFAFSMLAFYGCGLVLLRGDRNALLFVAVIVFCPIVHYLTHDLHDFSFQYSVQPEMIALIAPVLHRKKVTSLPSARNVVSEIRGCRVTDFSGVIRQIIMPRKVPVTALFDDGY